MSAPPRQRSIAEADLERLRRLVREVSGLEFPASRRPSLERAIAQALAAHDLAEARALDEFLRAPDHRLELESFIASLTIGETHFFRNRPQLDALRHEILPQLIAARAEERRLRIWSAGCATGEEAYSLAILIDLLLPRRDDWNVLVLATDINKAALDTAQRGTYGAWSFRQVPTEIQSRYFVQRDRRFQLADRIREMVTFRYLNLVEDSYPSLMSNTQAMDLILCRNVLIYFREETIDRVVGRFDQCLAPGGWIIAGHAESPMPVFRKHFAARDYPMTVCYQKLDPTQPPQPAPTPGAAVAVPAAAPPPRKVPPPPPPAPREPDSPELAMAAWRAGRVPDALAMLERIAIAHPESPAGPHLTAKILASLVRMDEAGEAAVQAIARDPLFAPSHYLHGLILQEQGHTDDALEELRRAVYLDPTLALARFALAALFAATGQAARAAREFDTLTHLLNDRDRDALLDEGDGVTVGRLVELVAVHRGLIDAPERVS